MSNLKKILIIVLVLGLGAAAYYYFGFVRQGSDNASAVLENDQTISQNILTLTEELKSLTIDTSLFLSPLFTNLREISAPPVSEPVGRPNPFAFIGTEGVTAGSGTGSGPMGPATTTIKKK